VLAAAVGGPTIATAGLATATGFLVLLLSPIPMVRGFGVALIIGIVFAFLLALTAGFAALVEWHDRERPADLPPALPRVRAWSRAARSGAADPAVVALRRSAAGIARWARRSRPRRVLLIGLAIAVLGWARTRRPRSSPTCATSCRPT
jgi:predicted RND superfamily exporter protein